MWWAPVNTLDEAPEDPQALAAGAVVDVPEGAGAPAHRAVATPVDFSRTPARTRPRSRPPWASTPRSSEPSWRERGE